jgi:transcriptional regulator with XRE-family HTH domain
MLLNLKAVIQPRLMRQYEPAQLLKVSPSVLCETISGRRKPSPEFKRRAALVLGVAEDWLFEELRLGPPPKTPSQELAGVAQAQRAGS